MQYISCTLPLSRHGKHVAKATTLSPFLHKKRKLQKEKKNDKKCIFISLNIVSKNPSYLLHTFSHKINSKWWGVCVYMISMLVTVAYTEAIEQISKEH